MSKHRNKSNSTVVSTGPDFAALRFTHVGMLLAAGDIDNCLPCILEFSLPLTEQEMFASIEQIVSEKLDVLGFASFTSSGAGVIYQDLRFPAAEAVVRLLKATFMPADTTVLPLVQDPVNGPCIHIPVDEDGNPDLGPEKGWLN